MEMSLSYTCSHSRPMSFNNGVLRTRFVSSSISEKNHLFCGSNNSLGRRSRRRRRVVSVIKASKTTPSSRSTLSSRRDVNSSAASSPAWLPRFEELDTTNMLLRQRIIFLGSQVDDMTADFIISQLLLLDAEDPTKDIKLFINSPGGSVTAGGVGRIFLRGTDLMTNARGMVTLTGVLPPFVPFAQAFAAVMTAALTGSLYYVAASPKGMGIYDAMKLCKADVSTVCLGLAASMAAFLLASGTKGKRFCMPNSRVMIHQPLGTAGGKATDMSIRIREMAYHKIKLNKIFSRVTGKPFEQIEIDTDRDNFMSPWEAKEYGLVDEVIDDGKPGLVAPIADASPPPKTRVSDMWKVEGSRIAKKNLPSEVKISQNGYNEKETTTPV